MKRKPLKAKEVNKLIEKYNYSISKKESVELIDEKIICVSKIPLFFYYNDSLVPTLKFLQNHIDALKKIVVDMGAIKFVINGADIMRPGITSVEESISKNECVVVVDENNGKPLAVGVALLDGREMSSSSSGKVIKNIHFVGDEMWNLSL